MGNKTTYVVTSPAPVIGTRKLGGWAFSRKNKNKDPENVYGGGQSTLPVDTLVSGVVVSKGALKYMENPTVNGRTMAYTIVYIERGGEVYAKPYVPAAPASAPGAVEESPVTRAEFNALVIQVEEIKARLGGL